MGLPDGQCLKCKEPIMIVTGELRPLCVECEKKINNKISKGMAARGKNIKGKCLVFPVVPVIEDNVA